MRRRAPVVLAATVAAAFALAAFVDASTLAPQARGSLVTIRHEGLVRRTGPPSQLRVSAPQPSLVSIRHKGVSTAQPVPILMYHVLADAPPGVAYPDLYVRPADFSAEMDWLERHGYHAVTLDAVWRAWHGRGRLPTRPVVLSFDDGYRSDVGVALPVLASRRWPGVLNLAWHNLGLHGLRPRGVRRLVHAGWEIDAHSLTHPDLTALGAAQLEDEVAGSRREIRRTFHVPADFFCYPAGRYDARVVAAVRSAGFLGATSTEYGLARASDPYGLDRVRIDGADGVRGFAAKLSALTR